MNCCKKLLIVLCCAILALACFACGMRPTPSGGNGNQDFSGGEIPDDNDVEIPKPDDTEHDFVLESQNGGTFTYKCDDCGELRSFTVTCLEGTEKAYTVNGNTLSFGGVTQKSVYDIHGALHGNIVVDVGDDYKFELQMSGLELYSYAACPITVLGGDKVTLSAKKSTVNHIYDMREAVSDSDGTAVSASIYAECDLDIQGKGSLTVTSVNNNGIHTKDDLGVKNLSLQVDCTDNALKGNDSVTIESGDLVLISRQGDGIKTTNSDISSKGKQRGTVAVTGGNVLIYAACDGIDAAYDALFDQSTADLSLQIFTDKYSKYSEEVTAVSSGVYYVRFNTTIYSYSIKYSNGDDDAVWQSSSSPTTVGGYRYFPVTKPSGYSYLQLYIYDSSQQQGQDETYVACTERMAVNNNYDTIALQSSGGRISYGWTNYTTSQNNFGGPGGRPGGPSGWGGMNDGNTDKGDHSTKGIKADNQVTITAGSLTVSAYDDALHAGGSKTFENGASPLGNVTISGGTVVLRSNDDGIHADGKALIGGGNVSVISSYEGIEGKTVEVSGGAVAVVSSDDGINGTATSGTTITVSGGTLYVYANGDGVDSNSKTSYSGIIFSGGRSVIISTGQADSCIDTENGYGYTGGYVIGIGKSGGMSNESTNCSSFSSSGTSKTVSLKKDEYLTVDGVATVKMPTTMSALVVVLGKKSASVSSASTASGTPDANGVYWSV